MQEFFKLDQPKQVRELFKLVTNTSITIQEQSVIIIDLQKQIEDLKLQFDNKKLNKIQKQVNEIQAQLDNKLIKIEEAISDSEQKSKKPKLGDYKAYYFKGKKVLEETPKEIIIECEKNEKTKTFQTHIGQYARTYNMPLSVYGEKSEGQNEIQWCKNINYNDTIIPFKGYKQILKKQA